MKYVFGKPWPPGRRELTLVCLPDLSRTTVAGWSPLARLVDGVQVLAKQYGLTPVPDASLHLTIQPVDHLRLDAPPIDHLSVKLLVKELKDQLRDWSAFSLMVNPIISRTGVMLDTHPAHPFDHLVDDVRYAISTVFGAESITYDTRPGHVSIVTAPRDMDTDDFTSALRQIRPSHTDMTVQNLALAWVSQNIPAGCYTIEVVERFELTGPAEQPGKKG
ncbi:hypothetical protein ACIQUM_36390 [Amycolatopsis azurea]|uniref:hypothetical protein n=1 Tax=Amycolatopsis azurea TaxID=36819 RepID=UPI00380F5E1F